MGLGRYDAAEAGRLLGRDAGFVVRAVTDSGNGPAIVRPASDRVLTFRDLVSVRVGLIIRSRGVADRNLRRGVQLLRDRTGEEAPLATRSVTDRLATSGRSFLYETPSHGFEDIGLGGHGVFTEVVRLYLQHIDFGSSGDAERWFPVDGVVIDPRIQAGAPCIEGTRVPTSSIAALLDSSDIDDVAFEFDLDEEAVRRAADFERRLDAKVALAA